MHYRYVYRHNRECTTSDAVKGNNDAATTSNMRENITPFKYYDDLKISTSPSSFSSPVTVGSDWNEQVYHNITVALEQSG